MTAPEHAAPITVTRVTTSRLPDLRLADTPFSSVMSDHMLLAEWSDGAWAAARIVPYEGITLPLSISSLHYGVSAFEGLKVQRDADGRVLFFRPDENARRLRRSAERLAMPHVPDSLFLGGLHALVREDAGWVPPHGQGALYLRPLLCSIDPILRVKVAERFLFAILTCPFAGYYGAPVRAWVSEHHVRAWPGGTGDIKAAGNYAGALAAEREARDAGCDTVLWLDARTRTTVEECGVMNVFAVLDDMVVTPPLSGTILPGVTRDSAIGVLRDSGYVVEERPLPIAELAQAATTGRLREAFGTGTAATVTAVAGIRYRATTIPLLAAPGPVADVVRTSLTGIATGVRPDPHGWVVPLDNGATR